MSATGRTVLTAFVVALGDIDRRGVDARPEDVADDDRQQRPTYLAYRVVLDSGPRSDEEEATIVVTETEPERRFAVITDDALDACVD